MKWDNATGYKTYLVLIAVFILLCVQVLPVFAADSNVWPNHKLTITRNKYTHDYWCQPDNWDIKFKEDEEDVDENDEYHLNVKAVHEEDNGACNTGMYYMTEFEYDDDLYGWTYQETVSGAVDNGNTEWKDGDQHGPDDGLTAPLDWQGKGYVKHSSTSDWKTEGWKGPAEITT